MKNPQFLVACWTAMAMALPLAYARTLHVAPGGDDGSPGTRESPLRTIHQAAEVARAGDTVVVAAGV